MESLLNRAQVLARLGNKSVSWLYAEMAEGRLPLPVKIGGGASVAWVSSEIDAYIARRIAEGRVTLTAKPRMRKSSAKPTPVAPDTSEPRAT